MLPSFFPLLLKSLLRCTCQIFKNHPTCLHGLAARMPFNVTHLGKTYNPESPRLKETSFSESKPTRSMYGIFTYIRLKFMVHVKTNLNMDHISKQNLLNPKELISCKKTKFCQNNKRQIIVSIVEKMTEQRTLARHSSQTPSQPLSSMVFLSMPS